MSGKSKSLPGLTEAETKALRLVAIGLEARGKERVYWMVKAREAIESDPTFVPSKGA